MHGGLAYRDALIQASVRCLWAPQINRKCSHGPAAGKYKRGTQRSFSRGRRAKRRARRRLQCPTRRGGWRRRRWSRYQGCSGWHRRSRGGMRRLPDGGRPGCRTEDLALERDIRKVLCRSRGESEIALRHLISGQYQHPEFEGQSETALCLASAVRDASDLAIRRRAPPVLPRRR